MSNQQNDQYYEMLNEIIEEDKHKAETENMETARELAYMGFPVNCTECGDPTCLGEYTHFES